MDRTLSGGWNRTIAREAHREQEQLPAASIPAHCTRGKNSKREFSRTEERRRSNGVGTCTRSNSRCTATKSARSRDSAEKTWLWEEANNRNRNKSIGSNSANRAINAIFRCRIYFKGRLVDSFIRILASRALWWNASLHASLASSEFSSSAWESRDCFHLFRTAYQVRMISLTQQQQSHQSILNMRWVRFRFVKIESRELVGNRTSCFTTTHKQSSQRI